MRSWLGFALAWILILAGAAWSHHLQTARGISISDVAFAGEGGVKQSARLYRPATATTARPAPAIMASHGFINTNQMQSAFAIELSRRGYVVLALDMTGHGKSGGIVGAAGYGGPAALRYLRSLPYVDRANIGLEGHSMGGGAVMNAAAAEPDGYRSLVLVGATPRSPDPTLVPRNVALVFGAYEEFAELMWQAPRGDRIMQSPKLQKLFGIDGPVVPGKTYGDIAAGTGRRLYVVPTTHPQEHLSGASVTAVAEWFDQTLKGGRASPAPAPVWHLKELATLVSLAGFVLLVLTAIDVVIRLPIFRKLAVAGDSTQAMASRPRATLAIMALIPAVAFIPLMTLGQKLAATPVFPQVVHSQLLLWAIGSALLGWIALRVVGPAAKPTTSQAPLAILAGLLVFAVAHGAALAISAAFDSDFRFWIWAWLPLPASRIPIALTYAAGWFAFFWLSLRPLPGLLAARRRGLYADLGLAVLALAGGFMALVLWEYATMAMTHRLATPKSPLLSILAIQLLGILTVLGLVAGYAVRRTGSHVVAAVICALMVTWTVTANTANHWAPGFETPVLPFAAAR